MVWLPRNRREEQEAYGISAWHGAQDAAHGVYRPELAPNGPAYIEAWNKTAKPFDGLGADSDNGCRSGIFWKL